MNNNKYEISRGLLGAYNAEKHHDYIYFAQDAHVIIVNGIKYGFNKDSEEGIVSDVAVNEDGSVVVSFTNGDSHILLITKKTVGLENVTNDAQVRRDELGAPNGVPLLDENGKIKQEFFSGEQGRVVGIEKFVNTKSDLNTLEPSPSEGQKYFVKSEGLIFTRTSNSWDEGVAPKENTIYNHRQADEQGRTNVIYRWDGQQMAEISSTVVLGEVEGTAYDGAKGKKLADISDSLPNSIITGASDTESDENEVTINLTQYKRKSDKTYEALLDKIQAVLHGASSQNAGVMSAHDKAKVDGISKQVVSFGQFSSSEYGVSSTMSSITWNSGNKSWSSEEIRIDIPLATQESNGIMSASDKAKLDSLHNTELGTEEGQAYPGTSGKALEERVSNNETSISEEKASRENADNELDSKITALDEKCTENAEISEAAFSDLDSRLKLFEIWYEGDSTEAVSINSKMNKRFILHK